MVPFLKKFHWSINTRIFKAVWDIANLTDDEIIITAAL